MALVGPSAQTLLLSGDSRAEGDNPRGQAPSAGSGSTFRQLTPRPPWQHWNCGPWWLLWSLCPWHGLAVSAWGQGGRGAAGVWFLSEPGPAHCFVPCWAQGLGTAVCPLHVLLSCPTLWAGAWAGLCSQTGMSCPELSPCHCCPRRQGGGFSGSHQERWGCKGSCHC